jgi:hypothetical protein
MSLDAPDPLTIIGTGLTGIGIECADIPTATGYEFEVREVGTSTWLLYQDLNPPNPPVSPVTLEPMTLYEFRARARREFYDGSLLDLFRGSSASTNYGPRNTGDGNWYEFKLLEYQGNIVAFHHDSNDNLIRIRQAATPEALGSATEITTVASSRYPAVVYDPVSNLWYLFGGDSNVGTLLHSAPTPLGPWTAIASGYGLSGYPASTPLAFDHDIARNPVTGEWFMISVLYGAVVVMAKATTFPTAWEYQGSLWAGNWGAPGWGLRNPDPMIFFENGRMYALMATCPEAAPGVYGAPIATLMVELDPATGFAKSAPVAIAKPPFQVGKFDFGTNGQDGGMGSPQYLKRAGESAGRVYGGVVGGWGALIAPSSPVADARTERDVVRPNFATGVDLASNLRFERWGTAVGSSGELVIAGGTGGAYGFMNTSKHDGFDVQLDFTSTDAAPGSYMLYFIGGGPVSVPPGGGIVLNGSSQIEFVWQANYGDQIILTDPTPVTANTRYNVRVTRAGNTYRLFVNGVERASGVYTSNVGVYNWGLGNSKTRVSADVVPAFRGVIHRFVWLNGAPPTLTLTASSTYITAAGPITLTATPSGGFTVARVEFYEGATLLGTDTSSAYTQAVNVNAFGTRTFTARMFNAANEMIESNAVTVTYADAGSRVESGLIAEYRFEEGAGLVAGDGVPGSSYDLSLSSGTPWVTGGGVNMGSNRFATPATALITGDANHTAIYVVDYADSNVYRPLYSQSDGGGALGSRLYHFIADNDALVTSFNQFNGPAFSTGLVTGSGPRMLAFSHDKATRTVKYRVNNVDAGTTVYTDNNVNVSASQPTLAGATSNGYYLNRPLLYAVFYNRVLSSAEMAQMNTYIRALMTARGVTIP